MQRRTFINLSAYTAVALALPFVAGCNNKQADIEENPYFFSQLASTETIIATGKAYLKANQVENDKNKLSVLLLNGKRKSSFPDSNSFQTILNNQVINDFKTGKTIVVHGWILSITEARQCALFSLLKS